MKSKLEELFNDASFGTDSIGYDVGFMVTDGGEMVDCLMLEFDGRFDVYLNLFDEGEAPYRNILVKGSSNSLEVAKRIAARKLRKELENPVY